MPLKKRSRLSNNCKQRCNTARKRIKRSNESEEQREQRLYTPYYSYTISYIILLLVRHPITLMPQAPHQQPGGQL